MWGERLGCASEYTVTLHFRGGQRVYTYPDAVTRIEWSRVRRGVSEATVVLSRQRLSPDCAAMLVDVWPYAMEVSIYRDNDVVWQGPVVRRVGVRGADQNATLTLHAKDPGGWLERRMPQRSVKLTGADLSEVGRAVMESCFAREDPNLLPHIVAWPVGRNVTHAIHAYGRWGIEEMRAVGGQGMDWSFVGRALFLARPADGDSPVYGRLTSEDFLGEPELDINGDEYASMVYAAPQPQDGVWAHLEGVGGVSPYFGLVEYVVQTDLAWNVNEDGEWEPPAEGEESLTREETVAALVRAAQSRHTQMSRPPITLRCSDGARLSPDAPVGLERLVPGMRLDLALDEQDFLFSVARPMRLTRVDVVWDGGDEEVGVALVQIGTDSDNELEEIA